MDSMAIELQKPDDRAAFSQNQRIEYNPACARYFLLQTSGASKQCLTNVFVLMRLRLNKDVVVLLLALALVVWR